MRAVLAAWAVLAAALLAGAAGQPITSSDLAALSPAAAAWVASDVERHTMETTGDSAWIIAVILSRGSISVYAPQRGSETYMPVPPGLAGAKYIDARMSRVSPSGNAVFGLLDSGAIVIARSATKTPDGRVYSPLGVIEGGYVEIAYTNDVCCAIRTDGAIQCFTVPSVDTAPMTAAGWRNVTAVLSAAPAVLCGSLGPAACMSPPGVPFRSISIAFGGATAEMTACAIQVNNSLPFCFGSSGYSVQLPDVQPAFLLPTLTGRSVSSLQLMSNTAFGTMLWARTLTGVNVGEQYTGTGTTDVSALFTTAGCVSFRCVQKRAAAAAAAPMHWSIPCGASECQSRPECHRGFATCCSGGGSLSGVSSTVGYIGCLGNGGVPASVGSDNGVSQARFK